MSYKSLVICISMLLVSGIFYSAFSQQSPPKLQRLSERADIILTGKVAKQKSSWDKNKTRIYTEATLQVNEYIKGNNQGPVTVTYPGGEVGGVGELYTHMPRFTNDENVLVFLKRSGKTAEYQVLDGEDGKIEILKDKKTGEEVTGSQVRVSDLKAQIKKYITK
jgi:hypothetical protein